MSRPKPWWQTHPKELWQPEDWRAARKAGIVPPLPQADVDPAVALLAATAPPAASLPGGLYGDDDARRANERRRKVNQLLEDHGLRPKPWT